MLISALLFTFLGFSGPGDSVAVQFSKQITASDMEIHLKKLASREFEGRETGKKGQKLAAAYLKNIFKQNGLSGAINDTGFYQVYPLLAQNPEGIDIKIGKKRYEFLKDFYFFPGFPDQKINVDSVTFVGYGIETAGYNDFKGLDVRGKVVVALEGEPFDQEGKSRVTGMKEPGEWTNSWRLKSEVAIRKEVKAILIVSENFDRNLNNLRHFIENPNVKLDFPVKEKKATVPYIYISPELAQKLLGKTVTQLKANTSQKTSSAFTIKRKLDISIARPVQRIVAENVVAFVPGTDLKDEFIVLSAHYDHLGIKDTTIYYGADDDGSGTTALLAISKAFAEARKAGKGPRRSILFVAFSGEEKGLLGSEYYSENPVFPLKSVVANLNIDMIGRIDKKYISDPNYVYIIGSDKLSSELHKINEDANTTYSNLKLDYTYNNVNDPNRYYYRSDHYNFAKKNVPVIFYFNGTHDDYHKHTDTVDKINFQKMEKISRLIFFTAWELANRKDRIIVDKKSD